MLQLLACRTKSPLLKFAFPGARQAVAVDVGAQDGHFPSQQLGVHVALEQDSQRVRLRPVGAAGAPDAQAPGAPDCAR